MKNSERRLHHVADGVFRITLVPDPLLARFGSGARDNFLALIERETIEDALGEGRVQ
jgi:hypothetical protein